MTGWGKHAGMVLAFALLTTTVAATPRIALAAGPAAQPPTVDLRSLGTLGASTIPLLVTWPAANPGSSPVDHYELQVSRDNAPWTGVPLPTPLARSVTSNQAAWAVIVFRVRAVDQAATAGDWATSAPTWLSTAQEDNENVVLSSGWHTVSKSSAFGGHRAVTTQANQTATFTFTGREMAWIARLGPNAGDIFVMIDGRDPASINLYRKRSTARRVVFTAILPTAGTHTFTVTTRRAGASYDVDAFVVLGDPTNQTLVGAGDIASCSGTADSTTASVAAGVPGIVFTAGDNVYPDGAAANYTNCYDPAWGSLKIAHATHPGQP